MTHLDTQLTDAFPIKEKQKEGLRRLGLETAEDLLRHFPARYESTNEYKLISQLQDGENAVITGELRNLNTKKSYKKGIPMTTATLAGQTDTVSVVWFHQAYIANMVDNGQPVKLSGKFKKDGNNFKVSNPDFEKIPADALDADRQNFIRPVYPQNRGVSSNWIYHTAKKLLGDSQIKADLDDPIPNDIRDDLNLPDIYQALIWAHLPKDLNHAKIAQKRFAFEEVFSVQLVKQQIRDQLDKQQSFHINANYDGLDSFLDRFDFDPTDAQDRAIEEILTDLSDPPAMNRLLEGDVGSGKTFVAAATAYTVVNTPPEDRDFGSLQVAYMAPTEILARQQFQDFVDMFSHLPIEMGFMAGSGCKKFPSKIDDSKATDISKNQLLKWIKDGVVSMVVGTHSLIQNEVQFDNLAYVIVDEQHRFGVSQRKQLVSKDGPLPHLLSMTATPIPRTLALTAYGDLDLSVLDEKPPGRKTAETRLVKEKYRSEVYDQVRGKLTAGQQAYVICPQIEKPDEDDDGGLDVMSVEEMEQKMSDQFPDFSVGTLHGRMKDKEKESVMAEFDAGNIDILVSTSVVEVGVNVPNATTIIIENAERFGLAQLHQLRGRVQRSVMQAHCFLFADIQTQKTRERLQALEDSADGFELAEADLKIRGPGALVGVRQSGMADIAFEALENLPLVKAAGRAAEDILKADPGLDSHPATKKRVKEVKDRAHFE